MTNQPNNSLVDVEDIKKILGYILKNWYFFIILPVIAALVAYLYTHRMTDIYAARAQILLKGQDVYNYQEGLYRGLGYSNAYASFEETASQMRVLKSATLIGQALEKLDLQVSYFIIGRLRVKEEYNWLPFKVNAEQFGKLAYNREFKVSIDGVEKFTLSYSTGNGQEVTQVYNFGERIPELGLDFRVDKRQILNESNIATIKDIEYMFTVQSHEGLIRKYSSAMEISNFDYTTILQITVKDQIQERAQEFLDTLISVYVDYTNQSEVRINRNTLRNIARQKEKVTSKLDSISDVLELQKDTSNYFVDLTKEEDALFKQVVSLQARLKELELQLESIESLREYVRNSQDKTLLPPSIYIYDDEFLRSSIGELYAQQLKKTKMLASTTPTNPKVVELDTRTNQMRINLLDYLANLKVAIKGNIEDVKRQEQSIRTKMMLIPKTQRKLEKVQRDLDVNKGLFSFLLSKEAETEIAGAGIVPGTKVIENARPLGIVEPDKGKITFYFIGFGILMALLITIIREIFFHRFESVQELTDATKLPILGGIPLAKKEPTRSYSLLQESPKGMVADSFRTVRTNIQYFVPGETSKTLLVTSILPGEGKTFCSVNLASILAMAGKKVLLMDFDLHKPKVGKALGLSSEIGISNYLIGQNPYEEIITHQTPIENLSVMLCGPVPPNASELILNQKTEELINKAKEEYEYIVVDTPPISLITDALILMKLIDMKMFVLNSKFANRRSVRFIEDITDKNEITNHGLILNGIKQKRFHYYYGKYGLGYGYTYGYGYGYGYGRGYGSDNQK